MSRTTPFRRLAGLLAALIAAAVLAACGSNVRLDEPPVEDRSGTAAGGAAGAGGQGSGVDPRGVAGVQVPSSTSAQPAQMQRIIYFDYDSFEVKPDATALLEANARYLNANRSVRGQLEGHTDERGGREYNLALGQKRAAAVVKSLTLLGVPANQLEAVSFGKERPAVEGHSEDAWAKNRRAEFKDR